MRPSKLILLSILFVAGVLVAFTPWQPPRTEPVERTIHVVASSFAYSPEQIRVNQGDLVTIELTSSDVVHGFYLDGYDLQFTADPGQTAQITFTAHQPGTFRFRCSVTCGDLHPFMIGKLHVGPNQLLWRAAGLAIIAALAGVWRYRQ